MHTLRRLPLLFGVAGLLAVAPAQAQFGNLLNKIIPPGTNALPAAPDSARAEPVGDAPTLRPKKNVEQELLPDINCDRPRERFNISEKVIDYGGAEAALRLDRLIKSDYKYSDLTPQDQEMLKYLAQTTVWLPVEIESRLGSIYDTSVSWFGSGQKRSELDQLALQTIEDRLASLKNVVKEYPGDIKLTVDKSLPDGAFARFGGVIQLSERFLTGISESAQGGDFVLAHELSHIYKRHAVKDLQYKLISSNEGWEIGRKVLQRAQRGLAVDPVADGLFLVTALPQLIEFVRSVQLKFGRDQELEADACSTVWLTAIGSDPIRAWDTFRATLGASADDQASYSASHPMTPEREARFKRKASASLSPAKASVTSTTRKRKKP